MEGPIRGVILHSVTLQFYYYTDKKTESKKVYMRCPRLYN